MLYRRVLINDIVARPKECEALVKAYESGSVCVANNFRCKIPHVKAFFAVLTDEKNARYFSLEERELIQRHVPWTRVVADVKTEYDGEAIELLEYMRKNQKNLVMKPSDEYGGKGVTLGWEVEKKTGTTPLNKRCPAEKRQKSRGAGSYRSVFPCGAERFPISAREIKWSSKICW